MTQLSTILVTDASGFPGRHVVEELAKLSFGQRPNGEALEFFKELSVRWYIVDLEKANNGLWDANSATVFANKSFVLIEIDKFEL